MHIKGPKRGAHSVPESEEIRGGEGTPPPPSRQLMSDDRLGVLAAKEVKEVLEAAFSVHFRVLLINQLLSAANLFILGETVNAGNRNSCLIRVEYGSMDKRLELTIAQDFQVIPNMDVECPRDWRDSCPGVVVMGHHFKPWGALQQDGEEAIIGMGSQSNLVTSI